MCGSIDGREVFKKENLKDMEFISYPYHKYGETVLAIKIGNGNLQVLNVSDYVSNNTYQGYLDTKEFCEAFAERIEGCLNHFRGKSIDEIKAAKPFNSPNKG